MDVRKFVIKKLIMLGISEAVLVAIVSVVFAVLDKFDRTVVIGGLAGAILAIANFFFWQWQRTVRQIAQWHRM